MAKVKFKKGVAFVDGKNRNKQTGSDNIETLEQALAEQASCQPCGCDTCLCYETICAVDTGELLVRFYVDNGSGGWNEIIQKYENAINTIKALYDARQ